MFYNKLFNFKFQRVDPNKGTYSLPVKLLLTLLQLVAFLILGIVGQLFLFTFALVHDIVYTYLKLKYGERCNLMSGFDKINCTDEQVIETALLLHEHKTPETAEELKKHYTETFKEVLKSHPRLRCMLRNCFNYNYLLETNIKVEDGIEYIEDYSNREEFHEKLEAIFISNLPNNMLWKVYIGKTPIFCMPHDVESKIPVVLRFHHCVTDGMSMLVFINTCFMKDGVNNQRKKCKELEAMFRNSKFIKNDSKVSFFKHIMLSIELVSNYLKKEFVYNEWFNSETEHLFRYGKPFFPKKYVCWVAEKPENNAIKKIKRIKGKYPNTTFLDVIKTAMSASIAEYFKNQNKVS